MDDNNNGIIVTQAGAPVKGAADYQKTIDTRWTFLDILDEREVEISHADSGSTHYWTEKILDHNLGHVAAYTIRVLSLDIGTLNPLFFTPDIVSDSKSIYIRNLFVSGDPTTPIKVKYFVRVFRNDISKEYQAPISIIVPGVQPSRTTSGVKVLKNASGGMRSNNVDDFSFDTQAKALAVQMTGVRTANAGNSFTVTVNHKLGYPPTAFAAKLEHAFEWTSSIANPLPTDLTYPMAAALGAHQTADSQNLVMKGGQGALQGDYCILITKEPAELAI